MLGLALGLDLMSTRFSRNLYRLIIGHNPEPSPRRKTSALHRGGPSRDEEYKRWIRSLRCATCGRRPRSEAAHVGHDGGKGIKCSDYATIPLCPSCHRIGQDSYHSAGRKTFAAMHLIDYDALVAKYNSIWEQLQGVEIFGPATARSSTGRTVDKSAEVKAC